MEVVIFIAVLFFLLGGIYRRSNRVPRNAWFTRPCPHCGQRMNIKNSRCGWCAGESTPVRWRWEKDATAE